MVGNDTRERRGYSMGLLSANDELNDAVRDRQEYCVRSWLSLLGGNASTNVIDTQMLGIVTIEIVLAPATKLILGSTARKFLTNLGFLQTAPPPVFAGNETCIAWPEGSVGGSDRAKHVGLRVHFVHEARASGYLQLHKLRADSMVPIY
jgi:hypothetical protein